MEPSKLSPEAEHAVHFREFTQRLAQKFEPLQIFNFSQTAPLIIPKAILMTMKVILNATIAYW